MLRVLVTRWLASLLFVSSIAVAADPPLFPAADPVVVTIIDALRTQVTPQQLGLVLDEPNASIEPSKPLVVFVPGLLAGENSMEALRRAIANDGYPYGFFRYSSHQGIRAAASQLSQALMAQKTQHPGRKIALVTHSMGGLVARCCLEDQANNPGNVSCLIMVAPPNHGSAVASLTATDLAKKFSLATTGEKVNWRGLDQTVSRFVGPAKEELTVGSELLNDLASRPRAAGVRYCIIAGSGGPVASGLLNVSLLIGDMLFADEPDAKTALRSAREIASIEEWTEDLGDGVVSVSSAKLSGVEDFVVLPFAHNDFGTQSGPVAGRVAQEIRRRLNLH